jgi:ABC-type transporter Mla MlaB component
VLRIHTETSLDGVSLRLEGKLVHPWVDELVRVWMNLDQGRQGWRKVRIDLEAVSFVDVRGRSMLATLHRLGCELKGSGPFISAVIEEVITDTAI